MDFILKIRTLFYSFQTLKTRLLREADLFPERKLDIPCFFLLALDKSIIFDVCKDLLLQVIFFALIFVSRLTLYLENPQNCNHFFPSHHQNKIVYSIGEWSH